MPGFGSRAPHLETRPSASVCVITLKEPLQAPCLYTTDSPRNMLQSASLARFPPAARMQANSQRAEKSWTSPPWGQLTDLTRWSQSKKARPCKFWNSKKLTYERPVRTGNSKNREQTSTWRRQHAPQRHSELIDVQAGGLSACRCTRRCRRDGGKGLAPATAPSPVAPSGRRRTHALSQSTTTRSPARAEKAEGRQLVGRRAQKGAQRAAPRSAALALGHRYTRGRPLAEQALPTPAGAQKPRLLRAAARRRRDPARMSPRAGRGCNHGPRTHLPPVHA